MFGGIIMNTWKHLEHDDRVRLETLYNEHYSPKEIAKRLNFHVSTIYREIKRGLYERLDSEYRTIITYSADIGQQLHDYNATAKGAPLKLGNDYDFVNFVSDKILKEKHSPAALLGYLQYSDKKFRTKICTKTLYTYIDQGLIPCVTNNDLWKKPKQKSPYKKVHKTRIVKPLLSCIDERPEEVENRETFGHWEMDTVVSKGTGHALLVLTERKTRHEIISRIGAKTQQEVVKGLNRIEGVYRKDFSRIFKTITIDNGSEFLDCNGLEKSRYSSNKRTKCYYCHPYSAWERGSNENANSMIRRFIPKGAKIENYSDKEIEQVQQWMNNYPRKILDYHCAYDLFNQEVTNCVK